MNRKVWKKIVALVLCCFSFIFFGGWAEMSQVQGIQNVMAVTQVYGDGEKIAYAVLTYPAAVDPASVNAADFYVPDEKIEAVCVNDVPEFTDNSKIGRYVVLKFAYENTAFDGDLANRTERKKEPREGKDKGISKDAPMISDRKVPDFSLSVRQVGEVAAMDGTIYPASEEFTAASAVKEPVVEDFKQYVYTEPSTGLSMPYNLYLPKDYNPQKKYPLVLFIADASANINEVRTPLFQGNGATVWAQPENQAKHECIVLAPQYTMELVQSIGMMTTDENVWTKGLSLVSNLLFDVIDRYSVDENRIYGTGQSQGGMANIALSDRYPDLFAAQLLVACQWNVDEMEILKDKNLWIVVCEGDTKAFPGMNEAVSRWEKLGAKVARNEEFWDSKAPVETINAKVEAMEKQQANINYTVFAGGNHMYTWSFAYNIGSLQDWMFSKIKENNFK